MAENDRVVLIGTYKKGQLAKWRGWYNYPISDKDKISERDFAKINELWLFNGTKNQRTYKAGFVGVKSRDELIKDYKYPASGKAHGSKYLLFETKPIYRHKGDAPEDAERVIIRTADFATSPKVRKQLKAYLESPDRNDPDLAKQLPSIISKIPSQKLRVCEAAVQLSFWDLEVIQKAKNYNEFISFRNIGLTVKPFVKWAGGKGQLIDQLDELLPSDLDKCRNLTYVEPFVGGGAMLFHMLAKYPNIEKAIINDLNQDLMITYREIKEHPEELIEALRKLHFEYKILSSEAKRRGMYLVKRELYNSKQTAPLETAALFIFLNRTCFNGLYRVNSKGAYNVPFGKAENPLICDEETIRADSEILQRVDILCGDFAAIVPNEKEENFFYFDPPYRPLTETSAFTAYSKGGFGDDQQIRLAQYTRQLNDKGCRWMLSNSDPHNIRKDDDFFDDLFVGFNIQRVSASRMINSKADGRGKITELLIRNY